MGETIVRSQQQGANASLALSTNFSRRFRTNISAGTNYTKSKQPDAQNNFDLWQTNIRSSINWEFINHARLNIEYTYNQNKNSLNSAATTNDHTLDLSVSYRIFKSRKGQISFHAKDVLNNGRSINIFPNVTSIITSWQRLQSSYYMISFEYRFNKAK